MKILVITDISVLGFYEYIGYIKEIPVDILTQLLFKNIDNFIYDFIFVLYLISIQNRL